MPKEFSVKIKVESEGKSFKKKKQGFSNSSSTPEELAEPFNGEDFKL